jgi:hypothetical protein
LGGRAAAGEIVSSVPGTVQVLSCAGDCNRDGAVTIDELIQGVAIILGSQPLTSCPVLDEDGSGDVTIAELIRSVATALAGCGAAPTATPSPSATATPGAPSPTSTPAALCAERSGGALITFAMCDETLIVWSTAPAFIDQALALLAAGEQLIPSFESLRDGTDCDAQWSWHVDPVAMSFAELAIELCDGCPSHIEDDKDYWLGTVGQYCPWSARVVAVDDRRALP